MTAIEQYKGRQAQAGQSITQTGKGNRRQIAAQSNLDQHPGGGPEESHEHGLQDGNEAGGEGVRPH